MEIENQTTQMSFSPSSPKENDTSRNVFSFTNCNFKVKVKKWSDYVCGTTANWKHILQDVSGEQRGGKSLAIMGPSGCGKSTLLNLLSLVPTTASVQGNVTLNGHRLNDALFRKYCAYVPQDDHLWPFLTCRQILAHAADFHLDLPAQIKRERVDNLIADLGLDNCQHTICGNQFLNGLSGGQKRRLSLGLALIKEPAVLFLDEPTSGLDSASATEITNVLKKVVEHKEIIVVCTIHQPSTAVFLQFDTVMLLSGGRVAYSGPPADAAPYFAAQLGVELPALVSPPEFILDAVNSDFGGQDKKQQVDAVCNAWARRLELEAHASESAGGPAVQAQTVQPLPSEGCRAIPMWRQGWVHLRRQAELSVLDPTLYLSRMVIFILECIFFACVYLRQRERRQDQVTNRMFLCVWFLSVPCCMAAIAVFALNQEFLAVRREIKNGMYAPWAYLASTTLLQVPWMVVLTLAALGVAAYGIANFQLAAMGQVVLAFAVTLWAFEAIAQALSVLFHDPILGVLLSILTWFTSFLFSGFFIREADVVWPLRLFVFILPFRWSIPSIVKTEFRGTAFDGATPLLPGPVEGGLGASAAGRLPYACAADEPVCYGRTGEEVLVTLSRSFTLFEPSDTYAGEVTNIVAIGAVAKLVFFVVFVRRTLSGSLAKDGEKQRSLLGRLPSLEWV